MTLIRCGAPNQWGKPCKCNIALLPGLRVSRRLSPGELCEEGAGFVFCPMCKAKHEVVRCEEREAA